MHNPTHSISAKEARNLIDLGKPISNVTVNGILSIEINSCELKKEVTIENCVIESLKCINIMFHNQVIIRNSHLKDAAFNFSYFYGGLIIDNCRFDKYLDFEAGGHNNSGNLYLIKNSDFLGFVNFNDCWFTGDVAILNNNFLKGTNIGSKEQYITLDQELQIQNNLGQTAIDNHRREDEQNCL